jgi:hypothetical protein
LCCVCGRCGKRRPKFILVLLASRRTRWGGKPADPAVHIQRQRGAQWLTSARFPQCNSQGSGITDNCHCQTSELLIVTAADPETSIEHETRAQNGPGATHVSIRPSRRHGETNEPCRERASICCGRTARCRPSAAPERLKALRRRSTLIKSARRFTAGRAPSAWLARRRLKERERGRPAGQAAKLFEDRQLLLSKASAPFVKTGEF